MRLKTKQYSGVVFTVLMALLVVQAPVSAEQIGEMYGDAEAMKAAASGPTYSPYAGKGYPRQVFWGDTHLHTTLSVDAGAFGNRLGLDDAYRFARGEEVVSSAGQRVRLSRPLDFLVAADHSDGMGFFTAIFNGDPWVMEKEEGRRWNGMVNAGSEESVKAALEFIDGFSRGTLPWKPNDPKLMRPVWDEVIKAAERYNDPGSFTAFIGYEWTSLVPPGNNLHRVVIYRDDAGPAKRTLPYTATDSVDPEDLWEALGAFEEKTGGRLLAIPHNGNLSNGMMFPLARLNGDPVTREYAAERDRWEPLYEVTQIKGDGEAHPFLSPNDEFADYETWDVGNLNLSEAKKDEMLQYEYGRSGLKLGLKIEQETGVNPYKFGMIGSTDSHTSLATAAEENFFGKHSGTEPGPERYKHPAMAFGDLIIMGWEQAASGYAAVWATENTREALFEAMERKEVYATTGPRMMVRFFGGWDFTAEDVTTRNLAAVGYGKGVPMGGDLHSAPAGKAPTFLVAALKDHIGANLDRIQVVKGWIDSKGELHEKIYDVAWGGDRKPGADGKLPPVGSTVDVKNAVWTNTIGAGELITVWEDPDFDPKARAFYYARVIEIPTPRWVAYDAKRFGVEPGEEVRMVHQERAYTSPIWYTP